MLGADGKELRQRAVPQPVSQPGAYQEESILKRRAKMAEEDRTPPNMWIFAAVIVGWCFLCYLGWFFVLRHDDHWVIDEIHHGHVANVRYYLNEHHELGTLNKLDEHHESLMHHAVESNQPTIVELLVKYGAKIDVIDDVGQMPIHKAVYHGYPACLKMLIDNGSPISFKDKRGKDPLALATWLARNSPDNADRAEIVKMLEEAKAKKDAERAAQAQALGDE